MLGPLDRTYLGVKVRVDIALIEYPQFISLKTDCSYLFPNLISQLLLLTCHLWTSPCEEWSYRDEMHSPALAGANSSLRAHTCPRSQQVTMSSRSSLWVNVSTLCYWAAWLLKYIAKVLSINTKERQILTGTSEHIKDLGYKAGLYFPKLINLKGVVLFLNITYWNRKLPRWVT